IALRRRISKIVADVRDRIAMEACDDDVAWLVRSHGLTVLKNFDDDVVIAHMHVTRHGTFPPEEIELVAPVEVEDRRLEAPPYALPHRRRCELASDEDQARIRRSFGKNGPEPSQLAQHARIARQHVGRHAGHITRELVERTQAVELQVSPHPDPLREPHQRGGLPVGWNASGGDADEPITQLPAQETLGPGAKHPEKIVLELRPPYARRFSG